MCYVMAVMLIDLIMLGKTLRETMREMDSGDDELRMVLYLILMSVMTKAETYVYVHVHVVYSSFALNDGEKST